mgnify:CR=1 FL=1
MTEININIRDLNGNIIYQDAYIIGDDESNRLRNMINHSLTIFPVRETNIDGYISPTNIRRVLDVINFPGFLNLFNNILDINNRNLIVYILRNSIHNIPDHFNNHIGSIIRLLIRYIDNINNYI